MIGWKVCCGVLLVDAGARCCDVVTGKKLGVRWVYVGTGAAMTKKVQVQPLEARWSVASGQCTSLILAPLTFWRQGLAANRSRQVAK